jgi:YHS domain-containing protein
MTRDTRSRSGWSIALCALVTAAALPVMSDEPQGNGVWKFKAPTGIRGEFNNEDPVGLAAGAHLGTDCSINWTGADGKIYCFTTNTSLQFFEESPQSYLSSARKFFEREQASGH